MDEEHPTPRVEVVYYMGRTSGFQQKDQPLARIVLVGATATRTMTHGMNGDYYSRESAFKEGSWWNKFLGWPLVILEEVVHIERTTTYRKVAS